MQFYYSNFLKPTTVYYSMSLLFAWKWSQWYLDPWLTGQFSCEVESNGKVQIRGVTTTGEKMVYRYSQVFEMQTQNLSPPGHFSISFRLPGPVDPQQFSGSFGIDGILEGIVMKGRDACWNDKFCVQTLPLIS